MIKGIEFQELKLQPIVEAPMLLGPWLREGTLSMVHAWRGTGKTFFALSVAQAVASSSFFLKWKAVERKKVIYLDGEMGMASIQKRLMAIDAYAPRQLGNGSLRLVTFQHTGGVMVNLSEVKTQKDLMPLLSAYDLIVIDNLSCCTRSLPRETVKDSWLRFRDFLIHLRSIGKAVIILHHTGKNGTQRGLSDYEDPLDISIFLKTPERHRPQDGTKFELHFQKNRDLHGKDIEPLLCSLVPSDDSSYRWEWQALDEIQTVSSQSFQARHSAGVLW